MIAAERESWVPFALFASVAVLGGICLVAAPPAILGIAIAPVAAAGAVLLWGAARGSRTAVIALLFICVFLLDATFRIRAYEEKDVDPQVLLKIGMWLTIAAVALINLPRWLPSIFTPLNIPWMMFLAWLLFSATQSPVPVYSAGSAFSIMAYVFFAAYVCACFDRIEVFAVIALATTLFCIVSIAAYFAVPEFGRFVYWFNEQRYLSLRLAGIAGSANNMGRVAAFGLVAVILYTEEFRRMHRWFPSVCAVILSVSLVMTNCRGAIAMTVALWTATRLFRWRRLYIVVMLITAGLLAAVVLLPAEHQFLQLMSRSGDAGEITSLTGRSSIWAIVPRLIEGRSWTGLGFASSQIILPQHEREIGFFATHAHNLIFQLLLSTGWIGVALFCLSVLCVGFRAVYFADRTVLVLLAYVLLNGITEASAFGTVVNICTLAFAMAVTLPPEWTNDEDDHPYQR